MPVADRFRTHDVENQPPSLAPYHAYATDLPLREALAREGGGWAEDQVATYGAIVGGESMVFAVAANENRPTLRACDRTLNGKPPPCERRTIGRRPRMRAPEPADCGCGNS